MERLIMLWSEARRLYPDTFLLLENLQSHIENNELHVEEVAVIRALSDDETMDEIMKARGNILVYHTGRERIIMPIRTKPSYRGKVFQ
jgi:hypothetical protein